ncbi:hypothetical protein L202_07629 [Cryptococcus amylolentus CBS 6039]|uniref:Uncharacterized protein n=2 Tax=Cryptococcus amylolentus TaxID=104669 RepID=A0A1E3HCV7_9TREE|nr:hypothetical protein L202_07629 [Cryptococcus amylolentus CBS 6039]ODN74178.1 hypothetical protein L202_07629 [Cryptococcus amylolentus CBS 6039]ODO00048.1 hypothetical protein I350_06672 [Cryptococcus amylolentus CBS 6273]
MGTRGLIGYILRNKQRKAMYNQFDSYPEGQGHDIAQFISRLSPEQSKEMADKVEKIEWIEDETAIIPEDIKERYLAVDGGIWRYQFPYGGPEHWFNERHFKGLSEAAKREKIEREKEQAAKLLAMKASCGHDDGPFAYEPMDTWSDVLVGAQGARALPFIQEGKLSHLIDSITFMTDGSLCEWEYFIDFHNEKLEVWAGELLREISFDTLRADPEYMLKGGWSDEDDEE